MRKWYLETGPDSDVILSTRVRLARNLQNVPFPIDVYKRQASGYRSIMVRHNSSGARSHLVSVKMEGIFRFFQSSIVRQ